MQLSLQDLFSDKQAIGTSTGDVASSNVLDWGTHKDDVSRDLTLFVKVDEAGTFGTEGTITVKFQTSANNSDWTTLETTSALTALAAGDMVISCPLPEGIKQYNRVEYSVGVAAFTVSPKFTAGIVRGRLDKAFAGI